MFQQYFKKLVALIVKMLFWPFLIFLLIGVPKYVKGRIRSLEHRSVRIVGPEKTLTKAMENFYKMRTTNISTCNRKSHCVPAGNPGVRQFLVLLV